MISKLNIKKLLEKNNKDINWLNKQTGITKNRLYNLATNRIVFIKFEEIEILCNIFSCDVNTLLIEEKNQRTDDMKISKIVYKRITELLKEKGTNINKFCREHQMPTTSIYSIGDGKSSSPSLKLIIRFCDALDISLYEFFDYEPFKNRDYNQEK